MSIHSEERGMWCNRSAGGHQALRGHFEDMIGAEVLFGIRIPMGDVRFHGRVLIANFLWLFIAAVIAQNTVDAERIFLRLFQPGVRCQRDEVIHFKRTRIKLRG